MIRKIFFFSFALLLTLSIACRKKNGCTDKCAQNYNNARHDDGSCTYVKPKIDYTTYFVSNCKPPYGLNFYAGVSNVSCNVNYEWDFGDGSTGFGGSAYHAYNQSGNFTVKVKAINGSEITTSEFPVQLDTTLKPAAFFTYGAQSNNYRVPCKIWFTNKSNFGSDYYWDFGDGSTSASLSPSHTYNSPGVYTVSLRSSCGGNQSVYSQKITVYPKPSGIFLTRFKISSGNQELSDKGTPIYVEMQYNNQSQMFGSIFKITSYPVSWFFPRDLSNGTYKVFDNFFPTDFFALRIWLDELGLNDKTLHMVTVDFSYLQSNYYPMDIYWDSNGWKLEASFEYQ